MHKPFKLINFQIFLMCNRSIISINKIDVCLIRFLYFQVTYHYPRNQMYLMKTHNTCFQKRIRKYQYSLALFQEFVLHNYVEHHPIPCKVITEAVSVTTEYAGWWLKDKMVFVVSFIVLN